MDISHFLMLIVEKGVHVHGSKYKNGHMDACTYTPKGTTKSSTNVQYEVQYLMTFPRLYPHKNKNIKFCGETSRYAHSFGKD